MRWSAFGQVESVALDVALFSAVYSAIEFVTESAEADEASPGAGYKFGAGVVVLFLLAGWHRWLKDETRARVRHVIADAIACVELQPNKGRGQTRSAPSRLRSLEEVAEHVVLVALSAPRIREGKARRREGSPSTSISSMVTPLVRFRARRFCYRSGCAGLPFSALRSSARSRSRSRCCGSEGEPSVDGSDPAWRLQAWGSDSSG